MEKIKKHIKDNKFDSVYFFLGEEVFLSTHYLNLLRKNIVGDDDFNYISLSSEDNLSFQDAIESSPMFGERKVVVIKGVDFSKEWKSDTNDLISELLDNVPSYTTVVFLCHTADKKSKIYKTLSTKATLCEFPVQKTDLVVKWLCPRVKSKGGVITPDVAEMVIGYAGNSLNLLDNEIDKMLSYTEDKVITAEIVDKLCTKTVEAKVFSLTDAVMEKKADLAFSILNELKREKEKPNNINGAFGRNVSALLQYKYLKQEGKNQSAIMEKMNVPQWLLKKYMSFERLYTEGDLIKIISACAEFDTQFKTGEIDGYTGLSILISNIIKK